MRVSRARVLAWLALVVVIGLIGSAILTPLIVLVVLPLVVLIAYRPTDEADHG